MAPTKTYKCRGCLSQEAAHKFYKYGFHIVRCSACGLSYVADELTESSLKALYSRDYFQGAERGYPDYCLEAAGLHKTINHRLQMIRTIKPARSTLLEIGCAYGFFLKEAAAFYDVGGLEISGFASNYASSTLHLDVVTSDLYSARFESEVFDIVAMWDVIEHLSEPAATIQEIARITKAKGLLALSTPDADSLMAKLQGAGWRLYDPPYHLSFFSLKSLSLLLEKYGFRVTAAERTGTWFTIQYLAHALYGYYKNRITGLIKRLTPKLPCSKKLIYLNMRDVMTVYAIKVK